MVQISAVIITFNEEANIARCLLSLSGLVDEIVVVDSFSADSTVDLCKAVNAKVLQRPFDGYGDQKRYGVSQAMHDLILSLDADEALSDELRDYLSTVRSGDQNVPSAVSFLRWNYFCGKRMRHCLGNDYKVRFFDRRFANWSESKVHEKVLVSDQVAVVKKNTPILHYTYSSLEEHERKVMKYAAIQHAEGRQSNWLVSALKAAYFFIRYFFLKLGFLDGYLGYKVCSVGAKAVFKKWHG